jgi:murein DD-endopeptidase MepM/ murein hydrolase activator NlpD
MNEKLPVLHEAINQLKENEKTDLADELNTLVEELLVKIETKKETDIKETELKIDDFLSNHEEDVQIGNWKADLAALAAEVTPPTTQDGTNETPDTDKKWRRASMSDGRKKFRKRTGIATAIAWLALFAKKINAQDPLKPESKWKTEITIDTDNNVLPTNTKEIFNAERQLPYPPPRVGISSEFGKKRTNEKGETYHHRGTDIPLPVGTPLFPVRPGKVKKIAYQDDGAGHYVVIDHGWGRESKYFHLREKPSLAVWTPVTPVTEIGKSGNTGDSEGPHLHLEMRKNGKPVNPEKYCPLDHGRVA